MTRRKGHSNRCENTRHDAHPPLHALMLWMAVGSFAVGTALRVFAAHNDLWFDEVCDREAVITSDHDFRNAMLVKYYKRYLARPDSLRYTNGAALNDSGADWLILHHFDLTKQPERVTDIHGNNYKLASIYRYSDLSGWNWLLYHNLNRPAVAPQTPWSQ